MYDPIKKRIRKLIAISIAAILLVSTLAGCKKAEDSTDETTTPPTTVPTTTAPVETTVPGETTLPDGAIIGKVIADELNIREGAGIKYDAIGQLVGGDTVVIFERKVVNDVEWGRTGDGWVCLTYVQLEGEPAKEISNGPDYELTGPITGKVIATELNIRTGPNTTYAVSKRVKKDDTITITKLDGYWGKTEDGWINTVFVYFEGTMDANSLKGTVNTDKLNIRSGPGTAYERLDKLEVGTEITILKTVNLKGTVWGYIGTGWISMDYVDVK